MKEYTREKLIALYNMKFSQVSSSEEEGEEEEWVDSEEEEVTGSEDELAQEMKPKQ